MLICVFKCSGCRSQEIVVPLAEMKTSEDGDQDECRSSWCGACGAVRVFFIAAIHISQAPVVKYWPPLLNAPPE